MRGAIVRVARGEHVRPREVAWFGRPGVARNAPASPFDAAGERERRCERTAERALQHASQPARILREARCATLDGWTGLRRTGTRDLQVEPKQLSCLRGWAVLAGQASHRITRPRACKPAERCAALCQERRLQSVQRSARHRVRPSTCNLRVACAGGDLGRCLPTAAP